MKLALAFQLVVIHASALYGVHSVSTHYSRAAAILFKKEILYIYIYIYIKFIYLFDFVVS